MISVTPSSVAHSPGADGSWHDLDEHLREVGRLGGEFAIPFEGRTAADLVGRVHDLGKADPQWQAYLRAAVAGVKSYTVDHKTAGALLLRNWGFDALAPLVLGHHGGLPDLADVQRALSEPPTPGQRAALDAAATFELRPPEDPIYPDRILKASSPDGRRQIEMWLRFVFSCLIDADRLDTARHFSGRSSELERPPIQVLVERFEANRAWSLADRITDPVASVREAVYATVLARSGEPPGWFELTAPTGAGKTIAALGFALEHAFRHGKRRVVTAVPFISVTEQVADVYRSLLDGEEAVVLEHHSGLVRSEDSQVGVGLWTRLASENWDASVIVTTTVRLLETLFTNDPTEARRLHRLADSVIVIDEVQSIPWRLMEPTVDVLRSLVRDYGCSVVLSTATQPPLHLVDAGSATERRQLLPGSGWSSRFTRVQAEFVAEPLPWDDVARRMLAAADEFASQCVSIVNTIADARALTTALAGAEGAMHLTTRMCPAHRRVVFEEMRRRLRRGEPAIVVSTQLIEAGVDVDFPVGFRAVAPMPALFQAAGRVNRHGARVSGALVVYQPEQGHVPPGEYEVGRNITLDMLRRGADPLNPSVLDAYYRRFLDAIQSLLDAEDIQQERANFNFATVGERYRLIVDDGQPVVVSYGGFDATALDPPEDPLQRRSVLRRLQPYTVNLRGRELRSAVSNGLVRDLGGGLLVWLGPYDPVMGLMNESSREALIW